MTALLTVSGSDVVSGVVGWDQAPGLATNWVTYTAVLLAAGGSLFLAAVHDRRPAERPLLAGMVVGLAVAGALGTVAGALVSAAEISGMGAAVFREPAILLSLLASPDGVAAVARLAGLALMVVAVPGTLTSRGARTLLFGGTVAVLSFTLAGHTVSAEPRWLAFVSDACHVLAASLWFGGLLFLGIVLHRRRDEDDPVDGATMVARFSTWATGALVVVVVAGLALAWVEVRTLRALVDEPYGWLLAAKVATVGVVVALGAYNNLRLVPAIKRAGGTDRAVAWRRLRLTVRGETAGLVAALAVTAVLVEQAPPRPHVDGPVPHMGMMDREQVENSKT